jgi:hypothetical protein
VFPVRCELGFYFPEDDILQIRTLSTLLLVRCYFYKDEPKVMLLSSLVLYKMVSPLARILNLCFHLCS